MEQEDVNILVSWRDKAINLKVQPNSNLKELGQKLQELTNVKPYTMRLFIPNSKSKGVKMLSPFSDVNSGLSLKEAEFPELQGKTIKMMGVSNDEIEEVSDNGKRQDLRILGFDDEEKRLRQRAVPTPQSSLKLPQGQYIFCEFRPLHIHGIVLNPPPSEALRRMHMLACDPGIIAIMNKHHWRVGIMTEMAPEGYVGISPKCILGFNKNHGEEISLRLRTDDLKGFRKYESIKKTLLHELAHMVFSEHDSKFFALNKQLNEEAENLDWTKSRGHTISGHKFSGYYEDDAYIGESSLASQKLGGRLDPFATPRASSVAAAYSRLVNASSDIVSGSQGEAPALLQKDNQMTSDQEHGTESNPHYGAIGSDVVNMDMETDYKTFQEFSILERYHEPDPDASVENQRISKPNPDYSQAMGTSVRFNEAMESIDEVNLKNPNIAEPDPDESVHKPIEDLMMKDLLPRKTCGEPDPDDSIKDVVLETSKQLQITNEELPPTLSLNIDPTLGDHHEHFLDNPELQRIEEPTAIICSRLQKAIDILRSEVTPSQAATALQTLFRIIRNVIEHPEEAKFRKLRKANPQFQRNVANYKAAMDVLMMVGFSEDVIFDEVGSAETFLVLRRNDPGLLWLAKSSLEVSIGYVAQSV